MQNFHNKNSILIFLAANEFSGEEYSKVRQVCLNAGKQVFITSDSNTVCNGDNGMKVRPDTNFYNINEKNFAAIILIGGKGAKTYRDNKTLHNITRNFNGAEKVAAAICSAPIILAHAGLLSKISATCWREDKNELINLGVDYKDMSVVVQGNIITAEGPKSAIQFAETVLNLIK